MKISNALTFFLVCTLTRNGITFSPNVVKSDKLTKNILFASENNKSPVERRSFFSKIVGGTTAAGLSFLGGNVPPAYALGGGGLAKANDKLRSYGLPEISKVPDGFSPLVELYGKGINRSPLLVKFFFPFDWVVTLPNNDFNGEQGTVQAGEYAKGDTATFFFGTQSNTNQ